jgi:two-component system, NarL family, nitrate/nitrite response regulator NarL
MFPRPQLSLAAQVLPTLQPEPIRIGLAGRDALARAGLRSMLGSCEDLQVDELDTDLRLLSRVRIAWPDVLLCDGGPEVLEVLSQVDCPVLLLINDATLASAALAAGARGVLLREASPRRIHTALRAVSEGMIVIDEELSGSVVPHPRAHTVLIEPLTHRELEVVQLLADGLTNKEIANRLGISDHTVKFHVNGILGKLGVETRTEAVVHAARLGIVVL